MVPDKNFDHERARDEDGHDQDMWKRGGSRNCKGCHRRELHPAKLPCGHRVCLGCVDKTEEADEHEIWYACVLCKAKCTEFELL